MPDIAKETELAFSRCKSARYRTVLQAFQKSDEYLVKKKNKEFKRLRKEMASTILKETDIILVTFNNVGSEIAPGGFEADVSVFGKGAQGTLLAVLVPRTSFPRFQACDCSEIMDSFCRQS